MPQSAAQPHLPELPDGVTVAAFVLSIPLERVRPDPRQPRKTFDQQQLADLELSIEANGLIQPVIVVADPEDAEGYVLVVGGRRYAAHLRLARRGLASHIQAIVARDYTDALAIRIIQLVENDNRSAVSYLEEAECCRDLLREHPDLDSRAIATRIGRRGGRGKVNTGWVDDRLALLSLRDDIKRYLDDGLIGLRAAAALGRLDHGSQDALFRRFMRGDSTESDLAAQAKAVLANAGDQLSMIEEEWTPTQRQHNLYVRDEASAAAKAFAASTAKASALAKKSPAVLATALGGELDAVERSLDKLLASAAAFKQQLVSARAARTDHEMRLAVDALPE